MSDALGVVSYGSDGEVFIGRDYEKSKSYSEASAGKIDEEVRAIIDRAYGKCEELLTQHREKVLAVSEYLLEHETMDAETFLAYM